MMTRGESVVLLAERALGRVAAAERRWAEADAHFAAALALATDPAMGVLRHVDAGYDRAIEVARERGIHVPMLDEA